MKPTALSSQAIECLEYLEENLENAVTILVVSSWSVYLRNIANELADYILNTFPGSTYSKASMIWRLSNGSRIIFRIADNHTDLLRYRGMQVDKVVFGPYRMYEDTYNFIKELAYRDETTIQNI